jgi:hypothetical protein
MTLRTEAWQDERPDIESPTGLYGLIFASNSLRELAEAK